LGRFFGFASGRLIFYKAGIGEISKKNFGNAILRVGFYTGGILNGLMLSWWKRPPRQVSYRAGRPIIDWHNQDLVNAFVEEKKKQAKQDNCAFVRVRPQVAG